MRGDQTNQWLFAIFGVNLLIIFYIFWFFPENPLLLILQLVVPLGIWEMIIFATFAPEDVLIDIFGEEGLESYRQIISSYRSPRPVLRSSGDHNHN